MMKDIIDQFRKRKDEYFNSSIIILCTIKRFIFIACRITITEEHVLLKTERLPQHRHRSGDRTKLVDRHGHWYAEDKEHSGIISEYLPVMLKVKCCKTTEASMGS